MNWYEVLGVSPQASLTQIRQAHRQAVRSSHPDVLGHRDAEADLRAANAAWAVLSNPESRARYDETLRRGKITATPKVTTVFTVSDDQIHKVVSRTKSTQDQRTRAMVRVGIIGVVICLVLLIFLSGIQAAP